MKLFELTKKLKVFLERQKIHDEADAEKERTHLLQLQAQSAAVEATGQATAEAQARSEAAIIEGQSAVERAKLDAQAAKIASDSETEKQRLANEAEVEHLTEKNKLDISKARELSSIETKKFKEIVSALGADTIAAIAQAGPKMQAELLKGLGLKSFMITDGNSPINLFNTAQGLIGGKE